MNYFQPIDSGIFFAHSLVSHERARQKKIILLLRWTAIIVTSYLILLGRKKKT